MLQWLVTANGRVVRTFEGRDDAIKFALDKVFTEEHLDNNAKCSSRVSYDVRGIS